MSKLTNTKIRKEKLPIRLAHEAFKKLYFDETITDRELEALFDSFYVHNEKSINLKIINDGKLWTKKDDKINIFIPDVESDLIEYFSKNPHKLYDVPPRKFEEIIATIFRNNGFSVELTPETRDGGFDILAVENNRFIGESIYLIECKRYNPINKIGLGIVQRMYGVVESFKANKGIVATTSFFSRDAMQFAKDSKYRLSLQDYNSVTSWINQFADTKHTKFNN